LTFSLTGGNAFSQVTLIRFQYSSYASSISHSPSQPSKSSFVSGSMRSVRGPATTAPVCGSKPIAVTSYCT